MYFYFVSNHTHCHIKYLKKSDDIKKKIKIFKKNFFFKGRKSSFGYLRIIFEKFFQKYLEKISKKFFDFFFQTRNVTICVI